MKKVIVTGVGALILAVSLSSIEAQAVEIAHSQFIYSVKFLCGLETLGSKSFTPPGEPSVKPGNYATAVNIHNFHSKTVGLCKKAVLAEPETEHRGRISQFNFPTLRGDEALEVDCNDIVRLFGPPLGSFIKGFVEITSPVELSVTAVYTSQTCHNPDPTGGLCIDGVCPSWCTDLGELELEVVPQNPFSARDVPFCGPV